MASSSSISSSMKSTDATAPLLDDVAMPHPPELLCDVAASNSSKDRKHFPGKSNRASLKKCRLYNSVSRATMLGSERFSGSIGGEKTCQFDQVLSRHLLVSAYKRQQRWL